MREPPADISADFNNPSAPGMGRRRCRDRQSLSAFPEWHCGQADLGVARAAKVGGPRLCTSPGCDEKLERSQGGGFKGTGAVWHPPAHRGSHARYGQRRCGLPWCLARPVLEPRGHSLSSLIRGLVLAPCRGFNTLVRATQACIDSHTPQRPHPSPPHIRAPPTTSSTTTTKPTTTTVEADPRASGYPSIPMQASSQNPGHRTLLDGLDTRGPSSPR